MIDGLTTHIIRLGLVGRVSKIDPHAGTLHWQDQDALVEVIYDVSSRCGLILFYDGQRNYAAPKQLKYRGRFQLPANIIMHEVFRRCITFLRLSIITYDKHAARMFSNSTRRKLRQEQLKRNEQAETQALIAAIAKHKHISTQAELHALLMRIPKSALLRIAKKNLQLTKNTTDKQPSAYVLALRQALTTRKLLAHIPKNRRWFLFGVPEEGDRL